VIYRGQEVMRIYRGVGDIGPAERARLTSQCLNQFVRDLDFDPGHVVVIDRETFSELVYEDQVLGVITDEDAKAVGQPRPEFARQVQRRLVEVIRITREEFSGWSIVIGLAWAALASGILAVLLSLLGRVRRRAHARVEAAFRTTRAGSMVRGTVAAAATGVAALLVALWARVVLPNLFYLALIAFIAFLVLKVVRVVFDSFSDDWAEPTYKLVRGLVLVLGFVAAFPYIPGSQSPAFQAIAVFLGLLVSVSSGSALSNIIAGTILTYTRAFRLGDFVRIGETFGEVTV
jgi:small-conductance mechanosensitive channel